MTQSTPSSWKTNLDNSQAAVMEMERNGVWIDLEVCKEIEVEAAKDERALLDELNPWLFEAGWFDKDCADPLPVELDDFWNSQHLHAFLHSELGINLPPSPFWAKGRVKEGEIKVDAKALEWLAGYSKEHRPMLEKLLKLRRTRGTLKYVRKFPLFIGPDGLIHPVFGPAGDSDDRVGALSGRLACKLPEFHQIPSDKQKDAYRIRRIFGTRPGESLVVVDYSALEVVILAQILIWLFNDPGLAARVAVGAPDIHAATAYYVFTQLKDPTCLAVSEEVFIAAAKDGVGEKGLVSHCKRLRGLVKAIRYGLNYGKGAWGFGNTLFDANGDPLGEDAAQLFVDALLAFDPGIRQFGEWVDSYVVENGGIPSLEGRWCDLSWLTESRDKWQIKRAGRKGRNYPMQAGGADIVNLAMYLAAFDPELRRLGFVLILQVHDELILRGPTENAEAALKRLIEIMSTAGEKLSKPFTIPLQVSGHHGKTWDACK